MSGPLTRHADQVADAGRSLRRRALALLLAVVLGGLLTRLGGLVLAVAAGALAWALFAAFTVLFFRDPAPHVPPDANAVVAPAHGRVDCVGESVESEFMSGPCRRISIFLSVFDVHVQSAPVAGTVLFVKHHPGRFFLSALKTESAWHNESVLIGMESAARPGERIAVRQIAGVIARRVVTWVHPGDSIGRSEQIGLIQFGSRCDLYLPLAWTLTAKPGDKVRGGETIVARRGEPSRPGDSAATGSQP